MRRDVATFAQGTIAAPADRVLRIASLCLVLLTAGLAHADESEQEPYGAYIVASGPVPLGIAATGLVLPEEPVLLVSLGTYLVGGSIIHAVHGNYGRAAASVGIRVAGPIAGLLVGHLVQQAFKPGVHPWNFDGPPSPWWLGGIVAGYAGAIALDTKLAGGVRRRWTVTPTASTTASSTTVGLAGVF